MSTNTSTWDKILETASRLREKTQGYGPKEKMQWIIYQFAKRWREKKLGLRTGQNDMGIARLEEGDNNAYEPVDYGCFDVIMDSIEIDPDESVFIDYGCGKGRAVILAAMRPFKKVIGLEISEELSEVAKCHVQRVAEKFSTTEVEIITANARSYTLPDEVTHVFLFNPFVGEVMRDVLQQIRGSLRRNERQLTIMYVIPKSGVNWLENESWLVKDKTLPTGFWRIVDSFIYRANPDLP